MSPSIKQDAEQYEPKSAKNITELPSVSVDLAIQEESGTDKDGKPYTYNYVEVNGERYRIPDSVLGTLQAILKKKPTLKNFSVTKTGEGRLTRYTVIPMD